MARPISKYSMPKLHENWSEEDECRHCDAPSLMCWWARSIDCSLWRMVRCVPCVEHRRHVNRRPLTHDESSLQPHACTAHSQKRPIPKNNDKTTRWLDDEWEVDLWSLMNWRFARVAYTISIIKKLGAIGKNRCPA